MRINQFNNPTHKSIIVIDGKIINATKPYSYAKTVYTNVTNVVKEIRIEPCFNKFPDEKYEGFQIIRYLTVRYTDDGYYNLVQILNTPCRLSKPREIFTPYTRKRTNYIGNFVLDVHKEDVEYEDYTLFPEMFYSESLIDCYPDKYEQFRWYKLSDDTFVANVNNDVIVMDHYLRKKLTKHETVKYSEVIVIKCKDSFYNIWGGHEKLLSLKSANLSLNGKLDLFPKVVRHRADYLPIPDVTTSLNIIDQEINSGIKVFKLDYLWGLKNTENKWITRMCYDYISRHIENNVVEVRFESGVFKIPMSILPMDYDMIYCPNFSSEDITYAKCKLDGLYGLVSVKNYNIEEIIPPLCNSICELDYRFDELIRNRRIGSEFFGLGEALLLKKYWCPIKLSAKS